MGRLRDLLLRLRIKGRVGVVLGAAANVIVILGFFASAVFREPQPLSALQKTLLHEELREAFARGELTDARIAVLSRTLAERKSVV